MAFSFIIVLRVLLVTFSSLCIWLYLLYTYVYFCNSYCYVYELLFLYMICFVYSLFTLTEVFPCFFLSCKANVRVQDTNTGHGTHSQLSVLFFVLFVCKCVPYCCHLVSTQLPLTNISIY